MEDLIEESLSPFRQLANAACTDIYKRAELRPYSSALVEFAMRVLDGRVWCPVVELAGVLGFDEDGLAYREVAGLWFIVRVCLRRRHSWPSPDEGCGGSDDDQGFGNSGELLVTDEAAVLDDPGEGSLDDPPAAQNLEALGGAAFDDLDADVGLVLGPAHEPPGMADIGEGAGHEGIACTRGLEYGFAAVTVLDAGGMDLHGEQPSIGVGQDVALAPVDLLARIVTL